MTDAQQIVLSFGIFVVLFMAVGILAAFRTSATEDDYILGGRSLGPVLVGLSAGATGNSGFIMFGAVGFGYLYGLWGLLLPLGIFLGEYGYWTWFPGRVNRASVRHQALTVPQLITQVLPAAQRRTVRVCLALFILVLLGSYASAQFIAAGRAVEQGLQVTTAQGTMIGATIILLYCTGGGFRASVWTDLVQAGVVLTVTVSVMVWLTVVLGGPGAAATALEGLSDTQQWQALAPDFLTGAAFLLGFTVFGFGFSLSQPQILVRVFAARDDRSARRAKWAYLGYVHVTFAAMVIFGALLRAHQMALDDPEQGLLVFANQAMAPWLIGVIGAGIFSAIASTADSQLLVLSSTVQHDLLPGFWKRLPAAWAGRSLYAVTVLCGIALTVIALLNSATIFQIVVFSIAVLASTLGPVMLLLLFNQPLTARGILVGLVLGAAASVGWNLAELSATMNEAVVGFAAGLLGNWLFLDRARGSNA